MEWGSIGDWIGVLLGLLALLGFIIVERDKLKPELEFGLYLLNYGIIVGSFAGLLLGLPFVTALHRIGIFSQIVNLVGICMIGGALFGILGESGRLRERLYQEKNDSESYMYPLYYPLTESRIHFSGSRIYWDGIRHSPTAVISSIRVYMIRNLVNSVFVVIFVISTLSIW